MSISSIVKDMFSTFIVGVIVDARSCHVRMVTLKKGVVINDEEKEFKTVLGDVPIEAAKYIRKLRKQHPFTYVSSLSHSIYQGAIDTTDSSEYIKFGIRADNVKSIKVQDSWSLYITKEGIKEAQNRFAKSQGLDLLFSPFALLYEGNKARLDRKKRLYALYQHSALTLGILNNSGLYFGGFFLLESEIEESEPSSDDGSELEEESLLVSETQTKMSDALNALNSELGEIGELEELDDSVVIEDFEEHEAGLPMAEEKESEKSSFDDFARTMNVTKFIRDSLGEFYKNEIYESDFIDEIVILDTYGISPSSLAYLRNTLLIDVKVHRFDISAALIDMSRAEIESHERRTRV
ncbi:MAG: hypothetical protein ACTTJS_03805 [Wolinella sp.]